MEINERIIRIGKSANINTDLILGNDYELSLQVHCQNVRDSDNSDGTIDKIYHLQMFQKHLKRVRKYFRHPKSAYEA